jgi:hypothetical protein
MACFWPTSVTKVGAAGCPATPSNSMGQCAALGEQQTVTDFVPSSEVPVTTVPPVPTGEGCGAEPVIVFARFATASPSADGPSGRVGQADEQDVDGLGLILVDQQHLGARSAVVGLMIGDCAV